MSQQNFTRNFARNPKIKFLNFLRKIRKNISETKNCETLKNFFSDFENYFESNSPEIVSYERLNLS